MTDETIRHLELPTTTWRDALAQPRAKLVDVRSPSEFALDHPTGARSVPLLNDDQRAQVGLIYKMQGPRQAYRQGLTLLETRIASLVEQLDGAQRPARDVAALMKRLSALMEPGQVDPRLRARAMSAAELESESEPPILIYCWRGGMRSRAFTLLLRALGLPAAQILGGYKGYRKEVRNQLDQACFPPNFVIHGMTGCGKTELLHKLTPRFPDSVLDLEGLAGHRSSILGDVGLEPRSQKAFETALCSWNKRQPRRTIVEGESRKIGDLFIPERLWHAMTAGVHLCVEVPLAQRARRLVAEYFREDRRPLLTERLDFLASRMGAELGGELRRCFAQRDDQRTAELLLEHYYDPRYQHSSRHVDFAQRFDAQDLDAAATAIAAWIEAAPS